MRSLSTRPSCRARARVALMRNAAALGVVVALAIPSAVAAAPAVTPVPPTGTTYNNLAVAWWQYALGQPSPTNPLADTTGANCATGQSGPVFFLVGALGSASVTRDCTVSGGKRLFFPLVNAFDVHVPGDKLDTEKKLYEDFQSFGFRADTLFASVDGAAVANLAPASTPFRACAAPVAGCTPSSFSLALPDDNLFGLPAGTYAPAVQDGFYLLFDALKPGRHTIKFGGTGNFGGAFSQDITYRLLVTP
jgi:hypothetical protein